MSLLALSVVSFLAQVSAATPAPTAAGQPAASSPLATFVPFIFMAVIFYFVLIRPQQKQRKELANLLSSLRQGDKVITASGIHGTVAQVKERTVVLRIAEQVKVEFEKSAVATVAKRDGESAAAEPAAKSN